MGLFHLCISDAQIAPPSAVITVWLWFCFRVLPGFPYSLCGVLLTITATSPEGLNCDSFPTVWKVAFRVVKIQANTLSPHHALLEVKHEPSHGGGMKAHMTNLLSLGNSGTKCRIYKLPSVLALTHAGIHSAVSTFELLLCRCHVGHIFFENYFLSS